MGAELRKRNEEGERNTYFAPTRRRITKTDGPHHVVFNEMFKIEVAEFRRRQGEFKSGRAERGIEEHQMTSKSMKELNKITIKFR